MIAPLHTMLTNKRTVRSGKNKRSASRVFLFAASAPHTTNEPPTASENKTQASRCGNAVG